MSALMASIAEETSHQNEATLASSASPTSTPTKLDSEHDDDMVIMAAPLTREDTVEDTDLKPTTSPSQCLTFIRPLQLAQQHIDKHRMFRNNMLCGAMFLECANAGDLAANVWNQVPAPIYACVLMGIGGCMALCIAAFAFRDAALSWSNTVLLRDERNHLLRRKATRTPKQVLSHDLEVRLDVNFRETGAEWLNRFGMDVLMGFGATIVGTGTLLAIGGRNANVFRVSNLLSGYVGNGPAALWGLGNVAWCIFIWGRVQHHAKAAELELKQGDAVASRLQNRIHVVKHHSAMYGTAGFIVGLASLVSATMWWGYVIMAPCLIITVYSNIVFRRQICYDRVTIQEMPLVDLDSLLSQLRGILSIRRILTGAGSASLTHLNAKPMTFASALEFILRHGLFADFCMRLLHDPTLVAILFGDATDEIIIDSQALLAATGECELRLRDLAMVCIGDVGVTFISRDHEVFLLDMLGALLSVPHRRLNQLNSKSANGDIEMG